MLIWIPADKSSSGKKKHEKAEDLDKTTDITQHTVIDKAQLTCNDDSKSHDPSRDSSGKSHDSPSPPPQPPPVAAATAVPSGAANDRGSRRSKGKAKRVVEVLHVDIISDKFWREHADILRGE